MIVILVVDRKPDRKPEREVEVGRLVLGSLTESYDSDSDSM